MNAPERLNPVAQAYVARGEASTDPDFERLLQRTFSPQDLLQGENLDRLERIADRMAAGRMTVPEYLRGNVGDCMAICMQAMLWNMDPFAVAQKTHIVSGRLGYEAQLIIAVVQNSGAIRGSFHFEHNPEIGACRAGAILRGQTDVTWGEWLSIDAVTTKNSPLWKVNPRQQMAYLQAKNWSRLYCPGAILGVYSVDELEDSLPMNMPRTAAAQAAAPPPASTERQALPDYSAEAFTKNLPAWTKLVESGKKTGADLLAMLSTKATLSDTQRAAVLALKAAPPLEEKPSSDDFVAEMDAAEGAQ